MIVLTVDEIIELYDKLVEKTGGLHGLRDRGLLESAVYSAAAGFDETEQYPTVEEKAARLAYAITTNHPFLDGNKRIGILVMLVMLELNGIGMTFTQQELLQLGLEIPAGKRDYFLVLGWIADHKAKLTQGET
ncbi:death on curing protein [Sporobacter termitidis DSM 10068]|uniref:Death on curing protein n=1 Tax=Sporobacter termitidis DSM 10068 TaxID=1123282 RepID=A0A1M5Z6V4_9FIRM|nr:type II toxin-antitoxin system death-on-curing family toxin [Sporobacter termitidis]SHI19818.1 death on curing protein [Sporobacter termitidis DSM 10068]